MLEPGRQTVGLDVTWNPVLEQLTENGPRGQPQVGWVEAKDVWSELIAESFDLTHPACSEEDLDPIHAAPRDCSRSVAIDGRVEAVGSQTLSRNSFVRRDNSTCR